MFIYPHWIKWWKWWYNWSSNPCIKFSLWRSGDFYFSITSC